MVPAVQAQADLALRRLLSALPDDHEQFLAQAREMDAGLWPALIERARHHGVLGVLANYLTEREVPAHLAAQISAHRQLESLWAAQLEGTARRLTAAFAQANVQVVPLKGPVLAARLYADASQRTSADLDLLVASGQFDEAVALLRSLGYRPADSFQTSQYLRANGHHLSFVRDGEPPVELHFRAYAGFGVVLPADALTRRARSAEVWPGYSVLIPEPEDEYVHLAVHASGHAFVRLVWLYDLKLFVLLHPGLRWEFVSRRAEEAGVGAAVAYTSDLLRSWLGVDVPARVRSGASRRLRIAFANRLLPAVSRPQPASALENFTALAFTALLSDTAGAGARLVGHHVARSVKRRCFKVAPWLVPARWSG